MSDHRHMIIARSLTKRYGQLTAVDSINFQIGAGRVVGFLGPNGAGKSTTIRMIASYLPPSAGHILVDGLDVWKDSLRVRQRIGYLPESAPLYTEMRVIEFLRFRAKLFGVERSKRNTAIETALRRCSLTDVQRRPIHQLSKGYRQRVGLAAAILHQPPVLILDEPTVGLDPSQIREVRSLIRELATNHTVLLSTHILPEVELTCDDVLMIARGRIRAQGTLDELRGSASRLSPYIVEVDSGKSEGAIREIRGVAEVQGSMIDVKWRRLTIKPAENAPDLREPIAALLSRAGCSVRELKRETPSLEQLFVRMSADAEAEADSSADESKPPVNSAATPTAKRVRQGAAA